MKKEQRKHAILPASGAGRWLNCTPSARLEEQFPDTTSEYAAEGTLAHAIAELKVKKKFIEPMGPKTFDRYLNKLKKDPLYQPEMNRYTDDYLDYITEVVLNYATTPYVAIETKLDLSAYAPEGFGTADCVVIGGSKLHVIDFKYGKGVPVEAKENPQLMLYGLGALNIYQLLYSITDVILTIFQPRADGEPARTWAISAQDLREWGEEVKPIAEKAFQGKGDFVPGEWCRFCRARHTCRYRAQEYTALEDFGGLNSKHENGNFPMPPLLSNDEVGDVLRRAIDIEKWVSDLKEYALSTLLDGGTIPGWKAVEGRSRREWDDAEKAFADIQAAGIDEAVMYHREPYTLAQLEKEIGKAKFAEIAGSHIIMPPGKPALVPENDKREAITNRPTAEEDFKTAGKEGIANAG